MQYKEIEKTRERESSKLKRIKDVYLAGGAARSEKVGIASVINS